MTDILSKTYFNDRDPMAELDSIMERSGFNTFKTLKQVELLTGIKLDNLRQRIHRGTLQAVKRGRDWFISSKELERLEPTNPMPPIKD